MEYKSTFTIPSVRIYMDELSSAEQDMVRLTFLRYNRMKEWYYNQSYNEKYLGIPFAVDGKTETALLKEHYRALYGGKLSDYYITSLFSSVNGMRKSQKELIKLAEQERMQRQEGESRFLKRTPCVDAGRERLAESLWAVSCRERCGTESPVCTRAGIHLFWRKTFLSWEKEPTHGRRSFCL